MVAAFFTLLFAHFLMDFPLQGNYLAKAKSRVEATNRDWIYHLGAHAFLHAFPVYLILGVWWIAALEFVAHFAIDDAKCRGELTLIQDQGLHIGCKVLWVMLAVFIA